MTRTLRVGSRQSPLALRQTELVLAPLRRRNLGVTFEVVPIVTAGDQGPSRGGRWDFTDRLDASLERGEIDLAVHSAKDLPSRPERSVEIVAVPRRSDPRDALVARPGSSLQRLPSGARLGSSSCRRRAQLLRSRPDLRVVEIHGNVGTRLEKLRTWDLDGVVLAVAGLERLGLADCISQRLPLSSFLPPPGQGALAVEARPSDRELHRLLCAIDHVPSRRCAQAERAFAAELGADCDTPLGALARVKDGTLTLRGEVIAADGQRTVRGLRKGRPERAGSVGRALARELLEKGADALLSAGA
ncbi:MAG: hydroxymethylbilane synthase [Euryarchaeota archaeon]|nr:hydroxymethylbilane synthase [Euryarchaeota archaeon]MDE1835189.1 hydroxymethylbilane synthase [Euryarchaeota archaeon]MDE1880400.1 hydroxymethylbilane synthase [Euryarchaeota archaeon]MDE2045731.1 hydroxymethylbilane synthase [Thermoplasmata archaeon]